MPTEANRDPAWRALYPFESHYFQTDFGRLHYLDEGPGDSSTAIVCIHGNPTWSFYYRTIVQHFRSSVRCLALDHLGCGLSDKPQTFDYCLQSHTQNLIAWIDSLSLSKITLVVHDWGGAIGLGAAVQRSDQIDRLLILNTGAFPPPFIPWRIAACRIPWLGSFAIRYGNAFARAAIWMAIDRLKKLDPAVRQGLLAPYDQPNHRIAIDKFVQDIPTSNRHRTWQVLEQLEKDLVKLQDKPTTFVWGMRDWCFTPYCLERLQISFPEAKVRSLADVGHYIMEEASQEVIEALTLMMADGL
jgi:cis-3-alkyl-4-acyloxetan-2-one decarboxylase